MTAKLHEVSLVDCRNMIHELESSGEYVPTKGETRSLYVLLEDFTKDDEFHIFHLVINGSVVGFTSTFPNHHEGRISIGMTYIKPEFRRRGYALKIRELLLKWVQEAGYREVFTKTWEGNTPIVRLNEKMEFDEIGRIPSDRQNGDDTIKYLKKL